MLIAPKGAFVTLLAGATVIPTVEWFSLLNANGTPRLALDRFVAARRDGRLP